MKFVVLALLVVCAIYATQSNAASAKLGNGCRVFPCLQCSAVPSALFFRQRLIDRLTAISECDMCTRVQAEAELC